MNFKRLLFLVKVEGLSCLPFLRPGGRYLATSVGEPKKGDFVVFRDKNNRNRFLVKRVVAKEGSYYIVASTFKPATAEDNFNPVPSDLVEGTLII